MRSFLSFAVLASFGFQVTVARPTNTIREAQPWFDGLFDDWDSSSSSSSSSSSGLSSLASMASALMESCSDYDLSQVKLPTAPTPLPQPKGILSHIAIGRGTQNYTCDFSNSTAVPVPVGAVATLYNMSCVAAQSSTFMSYLPNLAYSTRLRTLPDFSSEGASTESSSSASSSSSSFLSTLISQFTASTPETFVVNLGDALMSGHHFFTDDTTPRFDLDTNNGQLGCVTVSKIAQSDAPSTATEGSVPWLYLTKSTSYTATPQDYSEVYRVNTVGGAAPATCKEARKENFRKNYAAEYWFYK